MQNDPRSHGLWELTAAPAPQTQMLNGAMQADVAIVGGGFTGLSAALHLAEGGARVAVLEAVEIGFGGAGRNVGLVNAGMWTMPDDLVAGMGEERGEKLLGLLGNGPQYVFDVIAKHNIACDVVRNGTLHCATDKNGQKEIEERASQWQRRGAAVSLLNAEETRQKVGTSAYSGALLDNRAGTIQPLSYARGLAYAALKAGAQIFTGSAVTGTEAIPGKWRVRTASGYVDADWTIVSTDAYSTGPWAPVRNEQIHLPYFNFATTPLSSNLRATILPDRQGVWDTKEVLSSFRLDRDGRLIFGSVGALRGLGAPIHRDWAIRAVRKLFPQIGEVSFEAEWYGLIGMTDDNLPRFHQFADRMVGFSGYNGRGIAPGTTFGRILAAHVRGEIKQDELPLPATPVGEPSFRRIREKFYEAGAQVLHFAGARSGA